MTDDRDFFRRLINLVEALTGGAGAEDRRMATAVLVALLVAEVGVGVVVALSLKD